MKTVILIATKEFGDRLRSGWVIACALVWLGAIGLTSLFGLVQIGRIGVQGYERTVVSLLNLVQYLVPLLGLLLGHDLIVSEREDRTLALVLAGGVSRARLLLGKFLGGCLTLAFPLVLGFAIAGTGIGLSANGRGLGSFLRLALSGLVLGILFVGAGLGLSTLCRTRVQALVVALLAWCVAVFVFDLVALGIVVSTKSQQAEQEIAAAADAMHVTSIAEMHAAFAGENDSQRAAHQQAVAAQTLPAWMALNPVDLFRAINLPPASAPLVPLLPATISMVLWLGAALGASTWRLRRVDL